MRFNDLRLDPADKVEVGGYIWFRVGLNIIQYNCWGHLCGITSLNNRIRCFSTLSLPFHIYDYYFRIIHDMVALK